MTEYYEEDNIKSKQGKNYPQKNKTDSKAAAIYYLK